MYCGNKPLKCIDPLGLAEYKIGEPEEPEQIFDEDFIYDPNEKPTPKDHWDQMVWFTKGQGAYLVMPEAAKSYNNYLRGTGKDINSRFKSSIYTG